MGERVADRLRFWSDTRPVRVPTVGRRYVIDSQATGHCIMFRATLVSIGDRGDGAYRFDNGVIIDGDPFWEEVIEQEAE